MLHHNNINNIMVDRVGILFFSSDSLHRPYTLDTRVRKFLSLPVRGAAQPTNNSTKPTMASDADSAANDSDDDDDDEDLDLHDEPPSLPRLLASLALGARSVGSLPLSRARNDDQDDREDDEDDEDDKDDDEFSFRMSLPEFAALNAEARRTISSLLCRALGGIGRRGNDDDVYENDEDENDNDENYVYEFDDPELWERCADACDALYDQVSSHISSSSSSSSASASASGGTLVALSDASRLARRNALGSHARMTSAIVDMEKPQDVYQGFVTRPVQNERKVPFVPLIVHDDEKTRAMGVGGGGPGGRGTGWIVAMAVDSSSGLEKAVVKEEEEEEEAGVGEVMTPAASRVSTKRAAFVRLT